jgi:hypothetical protein
MSCSAVLLKSIDCLYAPSLMLRRQFAQSLQERDQAPFIDPLPAALVSHAVLDLHLFNQPGIERLVVITPGSGAEHNGHRFARTFPRTNSCASWRSIVVLPVPHAPRIRSLPGETANPRCRKGSGILITDPR